MPAPTRQQRSPQPKVTRVQITLPVGRICFPHLITPRTNDDGSVSYDALIAFNPRSEMGPKDQARWDKMVAQAKAAKLEAWGATPPEDFKSPIFDGTKYNRKHGGKYPELDGKQCMNVKSKDRKVGLCRKDLQPITNPEEIYPGMWGMADGSFYAYNFRGNVGLTFGINNLMKIKDDEPLAGGNDPATAFGEIEVDDEYAADNSEQFDDSDDVI